jgi:hypothetical protein
MKPSFEVNQIAPRISLRSILDVHPLASSFLRSYLPTHAELVG